ncbi:phosphopentomutase/phosphoglucosamine mutase [Methanoculleus sp. FWC-SCC1]|uniref:Phosphopentomutase/phosphoglucosamine mutase n=1 Tax=Methanoculleus frigidifontis TaxID=2584085 RepID=A0ABT8MAT5_9EURY|nr:phosphopentomutase/phosphoglucosamine mutase [Methanoculleus sp. FWC-SCC1]MDN7025037.1 phosphopentomutase/phosphoglucosamine mutase [Methanoculleus sp. FWC-SCC1]
MLFGSSGIRRQFDRALVDLALRVGAAVAAGAPGILIGTDTRTTSGLLSRSVAAGMLSAGARVSFCGIAPTPTVAFGTRDVDAGCMITASHNPEQYNGVKLFNPDGSSFTLKQQAEIERLVTDIAWNNWTAQGSVFPTDAVGPHRKAILDAVSLSGEISVVLDCGNGAGSVISPGLLADAGAAVTCLNCNVSGRFARPSEPLEANLPYLGEMVRRKGADCAVVHDGDADRMMAFDEKGRYIDGDRLLMLFARYLGSDKVVTTVDASMAIEEVAEVHRTPVGDSFVSEELLAWGDFGGEPSGSWIFPGHSCCPDGIYAGALFCEIASEWNVAEEIDRMPRYTILRESFSVDAPRDILTALGAKEPTHGIRVADEDGWCLVRASGTEPKVRITAEGKTPEKSKEMIEKGRALLQGGKHS